MTSSTSTSSSAYYVKTFLGFCISARLQLPTGEPNQPPRTLCFFAQLILKNLLFWRPKTDKYTFFSLKNLRFLALRTLKNTFFLKNLRLLLKWYVGLGPLKYRYIVYIESLRACTLSPCYFKVHARNPRACTLKSTGVYFETSSITLRLAVLLQDLAVLLLQSTCLFIVGSVV